MTTFFKDLLAGVVAGDLVGQGNWIARSTITQDHPVVAADGKIQATGAVNNAGATYTGALTGLDLTKPFTIRMGWILRDNYPTPAPTISTGVEDGGNGDGFNVNTDPYHWNGDNAPTAVPFWYDFEGNDAVPQDLPVPLRVLLAGNIAQFLTVRYNGTVVTSKIIGGNPATTILSNQSAGGFNDPTTWSTSDAFLFLAGTTDNTRSVLSSLTITSDPIISAATATPSTVTAKTSALASTATGNGNLTYLWTAGTKPSGSNPSFANATAQNTTITYDKAGSYTHHLIVSDDYGGFSASSNIAVTVSQTLTTITVSPSTATLANGANQTFTVATLDQFGNSMANVGITGSITLGNGTLSNRTYTSDGKKAVVKFSNGSISGTARINFKSVVGIDMGLNLGL